MHGIHCDSKSSKIRPYYKLQSIYICSNIKIKMIKLLWMFDRWKLALRTISIRNWNWHVFNTYVRFVLHFTLWCCCLVKCLAAKKRGGLLNATLKLCMCIENRNNFSVKFCVQATGRIEREQMEWEKSTMYGCSELCTEMHKHINHSIQKRSVSKKSERGVMGMRDVVVANS